MPDDINNLDTKDEGLAGIFGDRWHDETQNKPAATVSKKETATATRPERSPQKASDKPVDAQWEPAKPAPDWMTKLKDSVKWGFTFGCLSCLVFYWQSAGLMAESIAVPTIAVCTALAGWGVGRNAR